MISIPSTSQKGRKEGREKNRYVVSGIISYLISGKYHTQKKKKKKTRTEDLFLRELIYSSKRPSFGVTFCESLFSDRQILAWDE